MQGRKTTRKKTKVSSLGQVVTPDRENGYKPPSSAGLISFPKLQDSPGFTSSFKYQFNNCASIDKVEEIKLTSMVNLDNLKLFLVSYYVETINKFIGKEVLKNIPKNPDPDIVDFLADLSDAIYRHKDLYNKARCYKCKRKCIFRKD